MKSDSLQLSSVLLPLLLFHPGYISAFQAMPWNEFYLPGAPLSSQLCSQMQMSNSGEGCYPAEQAPGVQNLNVPLTSSMLQLPRATAPGPTIVFSAKQMAPADTDSNSDHLSQADHLAPPERDSTTDSLPQEGQNIVGEWQDNQSSSLNNPCPKCCC